MALVKKEVFVCDDCGERKRLNRSARHFCENPSHGRAIEMRPTRVRKPPAATVSKPA